MNNHTEVHSQPQADGDSRPFDTRDMGGRVRVHVEKSGPGFHPSLQKRDADLATLVEPMARLLYRAMQVQALGAVDHVLFDDLPVATKGQLVADARVALHLQSGLYRNEAERAARLTFHDALKDAAVHYPHLNPVADEKEIAARRKAIAHCVGFMALLKVPEVMLDAYRRTLTTPLTMGATAQVTLTALRGARS